MFMHQTQSFVLETAGGEEGHSQVPHQSSCRFNFAAMKLFDRFRKIIIRLIFPLPLRGSPSGSGHVQRRRSCDQLDPPKTSCSSYYSSNAHYSEAIADCIEFFKQSSQDEFSGGRRSDVVAV